MSDEKKLNMIKNYKFTEEIIQLFDSALKKIQEKPQEAVLDSTDGEYKETLSSQMDKIIDIGIVNLQLNIAFMKNQLAIHVEHELEAEIMSTKMEDRLNQAFKAMGMDPDKAKKMFGDSTSGR